MTRKARRSSYVSTRCEEIRISFGEVQCIERVTKPNRVLAHENHAEPSTTLPLCYSEGISEKLQACKLSTSVTKRQ